MNTEEKVAPLVRQLPWSHYIVILGQTKWPKERAFHLQLAVAEGWSGQTLGLGPGLEASR